MLQQQKVLDFCVGLIGVSTDLTKPESIYLIEDGLVLWYCTLSSSPPDALPKLLPLYPRITAIMECNFEHTRIAMRIIEEYLIIGKGEFLQVFPPPADNLLQDLRCRDGAHF